MAATNYKNKTDNTLSSKAMEKAFSPEPTVDKFVETDWQRFGSGTVQRRALVFKDDRNLTCVHGRFWRSCRLCRLCRQQKPPDNNDVKKG
jgi:hypothetical protein